MKRSASSSPIEEHHEAKKAKLECSAERTSPALTAPAEQEPPPTSTVVKEPAAYETPKDDKGTPINETSTGFQTVDDKIPVRRISVDKAPKNSTPSNKTAIDRKAGDRFTPWTPPQASNPIPPVQAHWGIVPRTGGHRPPGPQPSACDSDGAVVPPLWEDRKGAVRLKRGSRFIHGYDQAEHMYIRMMDSRPISSKNQAPRRKPTHYYYGHGMPDFEDTKAVNDINKALKNFIDANSNKEAPFTAIERRVMADLFVETPDASIWDIAERFNDKAHPSLVPRKASTPRVASSRASVTMKDIPLEKLWADKKAAERGLKEKVVKKPKMSDTVGVTKRKRTTKKSDKKQKLESVIAAADTAQASVRPMSEQPRLSDDDESILELAGAYSTVDDLSPYSRAVMASSGYGYGTSTVEQKKQTLATQTPNSADETDNVKSPDHIVVPSSALADADAAVNAQGVEETSKVVNVVPATLPVATSDAQSVVSATKIVSQLEMRISEVQPAVQTETVVEETRAESNVAAVGNVAAESSATVATTTSTFVERAVRKAQIDENYGDDDDLDGLF